MATRKETVHDKARQEAVDSTQPSTWTPPVGYDGEPIEAHGVTPTDSYRRGNDEPADDDL